MRADIHRCYRCYRKQAEEDNQGGREDIQKMLHDADEEDTH